MENYLSQEQSLERSYIKEERKILLHRVLSELATDYRTILWLVFFEGFSNKEAAIALKKNDRQIKNLLYRAKQSLKSKLEKEGFTYEEL
jgi:RNA polymerase sigma-70 factor (ECF subfamily)